MLDSVPESKEPRSIYNYFCRALDTALNEAAANLLRTLLIARYGQIEAEIYPARGLCSFYAEQGGLLVGFEKG